VFSEYPDIMNFNQFRKALNIGKNTAYNLLKSKEIQYFLIGKNYKIPKMAVINYVNQKLKEKSQC